MSGYSVRHRGRSPTLDQQKPLNGTGTLLQIANLLNQILDLLG